jgi:hypothetical protein
MGLDGSCFDPSPSEPIALRVPIAPVLLDYRDRGTQHKRHVGCKPFCQHLGRAGQSVGRRDCQQISVPCLPTPQIFRLEPKPGSSKGSLVPVRFAFLVKLEPFTGFLRVFGVGKQFDGLLLPQYSLPKIA